MIAYIWRHETDFDCWRCSKDPNQKRIKGCDTKSKRPHKRGHRDCPVEFDICPVRFVELDVVEFVDSYELSKGEISLSEQWELPPPFIEAVFFTRGQKSRLQAELIKGAGK